MKPADRAVRASQIADAYDAGASAADLAEQHGISQSTVHRILVQQGVALRGREWIRWGGTRTMEIVAGSQAGLTTTELAEQHGLSVNRVRQLLARARHEGLDPSAAPRPRIPAPRVAVGRRVDGGCSRCRGSQRWQRWGATLWAVCESCGVMSSPRPLRGRRQSA
ncbi:hypothetical protein SAMN06264364_14918 [Quadrisphaera granulorum]|uniref:Helix-turn-helix domain-containing protein n=1 Tax=Quadrisphaera granulorum TaxID=317664 RepID=A0A315ZLS9_9ACTN|nr:hypothetical protein BXY45_14918 [Quadrisphaera granulorum]SZE99097.1 hypothetical protein SAMN06264364_14918 [Quadrisphaera granulorum]